MKNIIIDMQNESSMMFMAGITIVIFLIIVLVVVISAMKVKRYKEKYREMEFLNQKSSRYIEDLEEKLHHSTIKNASYEQKLMQFIDIKKEFNNTISEKNQLANNYNLLEKIYTEVKTKLDNALSLNITMQEEYDKLQVKADDIHESNIKYRTNNARLVTKLESDERYAITQKEIMNNHKKEIKNELEALTNKVFNGNTKKFSDFSKENIDNIIKPLHAEINEFRKQVANTYNEESKDRAVLKNEIKSLKELNEKISKDAIELTNALKGGNKQQGIWGEMVLERVLEASGLRKGFEFDTEVTLHSDESERMRPDVIVHLPDNRDLIIDAKTSLVSYERYINAKDEESKSMYMKGHLTSIKLHIESLGDKNYERLKEVNTLDFIFMFMPIEGALAIALEHDSSIYDSAFKKKILLVGPTTLLVAMRAVENIWKYKRQNQNAQEIARRAGSMYDKFVGFSEDLIKISKQIDGIQGSFSAAKNKLSDGKGNLVRQAQQLKDLGVQTSKKIPKELNT